MMNILSYYLCMMLSIKIIELLTSLHSNRHSYIYIAITIVEDEMFISLLKRQCKITPAFIILSFFILNVYNFII